MSESHKKLLNIIKYWNTDLLCSLESSTSHADPDLSYLDNVIENRLLQNLLSEYRQEKCDKCLDVGAGYGRFAPTFLKFFSETVLLEAADQIFSKLLDLWKNEKSIDCKSGTFESFEEETGFDLIFSSGVLYLYDDEMVYQFLEKAKRSLNKQGLLILRDFVAEPERVMKSAYVENGSCCYRSPQFWSDTASSLGFPMLQILRSKPRLAFLRNMKVLRLLRLLHLSVWLRSPITIDAAMRFGNMRMKGNDIQTVFIVMRAR